MIALFCLLSYAKLIECVTMRKGVIIELAIKDQALQLLRSL